MISCQCSCPSLRPIRRTYSLTARKGTTGHLCGLRGLLDSLGAAAGDTLCFEPAGALTARVTMIKTAAAAGAAASSGGQAAVEQLAEDEQEEEGEEDAMAVDDEEEGWEAEPQQAQQAQHSPAAVAESVAVEAAGGTGSGRVPSQQAVQQRDASALWEEVGQLLETAEEHGERLCQPRAALCDCLNCMPVAFRANAAAATLHTFPSKSLPPALSPHRLPAAGRLGCLPRQV